MVVVDLTSTDPLVMYELGIAHTVGKESLVLCRRGSCPKLPAKLIGANVLEYDEGEDGLVKLRADMAEALHQMINPVMGSD